MPSSFSLTSFSANRARHWAAFSLVLLGCCFQGALGQPQNASIPVGSTSNSNGATSDEQHAYWAVSVGLNSISLCLQSYLFYLYWKFDILHKSGVSAFILKSTGDFVFALTYFIHHIGNLVTDGNFTENNTLCQITTAATSMSLMMDLYADMSISYVAYITVQSAASQREVWVTPVRLFLGAAISAMYGLTWVMAMVYDGTAGPYYGIYCFCNSWAHFSSGGMLFIVISVTLFTMAFNYYRLFVFVRANTLKNDKYDMSLRVALRGVLLIGVQLVTWIPLLISTIVNIAEVPPNIPFEMFAGWSVKINVFCGSLITLTFIRNFSNKFSTNRSASTTQSAPPPPISLVERDSVREIRMSVGFKTNGSKSQPASPTARQLHNSSVSVPVRV